MIIINVFIAIALVFYVPLAVAVIYALINLFTKKHPVGGLVASGVFLLYSLFSFISMFIPDEQLGSSMDISFAIIVFEFLVLCTIPLIFLALSIQIFIQSKKQVQQIS